MREILIKSEKDTALFAQSLSRELNKGDIVALVGDLGTGKTTLSKYIAKELGVKESITSPTFTIVQEYLSGRLPLYHFDVYRISNLEEMYQIGYEDYFFGEGVCIIEWADIVEEIIPEGAKVIFIEYGQGPEERIYRCSF